ncbi:MAG: WD40 repeat domain-containing serine/threonine protein kinase [Candidatus Xenobia bacterium]
MLQGRYNIQRELGRGSAGVVYLAEDVSLHGHQVAIKSLPLQGGDGAALQQEAKLLSRWAHPNLVRVTDCFREDDRLYIVMDYIEGRTLKAEMPCLDVPRALGWMGQMLDALEYLHGQSPPIIVRDLKPENLMLDRDGRLRLIDFGLARPVTAGAATVAAGTPGYSPVEQYGQVPLDVRADIYALGATMYAVLTGHEPVPAVQRAAQPLPAPRELNPAISPALQDVILQCMQVRREDRYAVVAEVRDALEAARAGRRPDPTRALGMVCLVLVVAVLGALFTVRRPSPATPQAIFRKDVGDHIERLVGFPDGSALVGTRHSAITCTGNGTLSRTVSSPQLLDRVAFNPDGSVLCGSDGAALGYLDLAGDRSWHSLDSLPGPLSAITVAADGVLWTAAERPSGCWLARWNLAAGEATEVRDGTVPGVVIHQVVATSDYVAWTEGDELMVGNAATGRLLWHFPCGGALLAIAGDKLATLDRDSRATWWDPTGQVSLQRGDAAVGVPVAIAASPDGTRLAVAGEDPGIAILASDTGKRLETVPVGRGVTALAFSAHGFRLLCARDRELSVWPVGQP